MKIILQPTKTVGYGLGSTTAQPSVTIEHPHDDLTLDDVLELLAGALIAYGFAPASVWERLGDDDSVGTTLNRRGDDES